MKNKVEDVSQRHIAATWQRNTSGV